MQQTNKYKSYDGASPHSLTSLLTLFQQKFNNAMPFSPPPPPPTNVSLPKKDRMAGLDKSCQLLMMMLVMIFVQGHILTLTVILMLMMMMIFPVRSPPDSDLHIDAADDDDCDDDDVRAFF